MLPAADKTDRNDVKGYRPCGKLLVRLTHEELGNSRVADYHDDHWCSVP
jgi:hypothetical protein